MWKELVMLGRMLFQGKPSDVERLELLETEHFPISGYKYMFWCGRMIYRKSMKERIQEEWVYNRFAIDKNHETIHLMQAKTCQSWPEYYVKYLMDWLKGFPFIPPISAAYYTTRYESEAYANESNLDYCKNYDEKNLSKYVFKNRRNLYKTIGGTPRSWKNYVKTIK